jgi:hypothetical protein
MTTADIAREFVDFCRAGKFAECGDKHWADHVVSHGTKSHTPVRRGKAAVRDKNAWWSDAHEVHGVEVFGPYIHGDQFTTRFVMDVTPKESGARHTVEGIALYTVEDGKIVEERFFYAE